MTTTTNNTKKHKLKTDEYIAVMTTTSPNNVTRTSSTHWLSFNPCSYPGPPGPGPGRVASADSVEARTAAPCYTVIKSRADDDDKAEDSCSRRCRRTNKTSKMTIKQTYSNGNNNNNNINNINIKNEHRSNCTRTLPHIVRWKWNFHFNDNKKNIIDNNPTTNIYNNDNNNNSNDKNTTSKTNLFPYSHHKKLLLTNFFIFLLWFQLTPLVGVVGCNNNNLSSHTTPQHQPSNIANPSARNVTRSQRELTPPSSSSSLSSSSLAISQIYMPPLKSSMQQQQQSLSASSSSSSTLSTTRKSVDGHRKLISSELTPLSLAPLNLNSYNGKHTDNKLNTKLNHHNHNRNNNNYNSNNNNNQNYHHPKKLKRKHQQHHLSTTTTTTTTTTTATPQTETKPVLSIKPHQRHQRHHQTVAATTSPSNYLNLLKKFDQYLLELEKNLQMEAIQKYQQCPNCKSNLDKTIKNTKQTLNKVQKLFQQTVATAAAASSMPPRQLEQYMNAHLSVGAQESLADLSLSLSPEFSNNSPQSANTAGYHDGYREDDGVTVDEDEDDGVGNLSVDEIQAQQEAQDWEATAFRNFLSIDDDESGDEVMDAEDEQRPSTDVVRLESIKQQILSKLGLKTKPVVTLSMPRELILETLSRAEESTPNQPATGGGAASIAASRAHQNAIFASDVVSQAETIVGNALGRDLDESQNYQFVSSAVHKTPLSDDEDNLNKNNLNFMEDKYWTIDDNRADQLAQQLQYESVDNIVSDSDDDDTIDENLKRLRTTGYGRLQQQYDHRLPAISDSSSSGSSFSSSGGSSAGFGRGRARNNKSDMPTNDNQSNDSEMRSKPEKNRSGINGGSAGDNGGDGAADDDLEDYFESDEPDDFYGRTREIISFAEKGPLLNGQRLLEFSTTTDDRTSSQELRVRTAALWLRVDSKVTSQSNAERRFHRFGGSFERRNITLWIFRIVRPLAELNNTSFLSDKDFDKFTELCAKLMVSSTKMGWQKFDLTHTIRRWYQEEARSNLQLLIDCSGCGNRVQIKLFDPSLSTSGDAGADIPSKGEKVHQKILKHHILESGGLGRSTHTAPPNEFTVTEQIHRPFLVVHTDPNIMKRVRRRALDCSGAVRGQCCKQRFFVSFKALGWDDWIIAPHGYFANYCRGDCGGAHRTPDTFLNYHTHIMQEFRKNEDKMKDEHKLNGMQPCCAPLKFSSMSLIYFGPDSNIIKRDLPKMVVDECGCP